MIRSLITEYGIGWTINRSLYSFKLKMLNWFPQTEVLFEKKIDIKRINLFNMQVEEIENFLKRLSDEKKNKIIQVADNAILGKILGFSSIELDYGNPINWQYNPITNKNVDKSLKWFQISDFDKERGDIKLIWEASRFSHFYYLSRAYMLTKDIKYYNAFATQLNDWVEKNPYSYGANYKCGQEATLRMINVMINFSIFDSYGLTNKDGHQNVVKIIESSYKKVLSNFFYAYKCIKNNHTLSEIIGLIVGAWCSKDEKKLNRSFDLLNDVINEQFRIDGGYIQNSFNYQRFALQLMELILSLENKLDYQISDMNKDLIRKSINQLYQVQEKNGDVPNYGPNDGALIFPINSCNYRDFRPVINTLSTLLNNKRLYNHGDYDEELLWFGINNIENIEINEIEKKSKAFNDSGLYTLRHNDGFLMTILQDLRNRPAQMDQLHVDLWHEEKNIFCDLGTYSYASDIGKNLALTSSHNTVKVNGIEQMKKRGSFFIYDWTKSKDVKFRDDYFQGTLISRNGYQHTREIRNTELGYGIKDVIKSNKKECEIIFNTPYEVETHDNTFYVSNNDKILCKVITDGEISIEKTYRSLYYMEKETINKIKVKYNFEDGLVSASTKIDLY